MMYSTADLPASRVQQHGSCTAGLSVTSSDTAADVQMTAPRDMTDESCISAGSNAKALNLAAAAGVIG